ncbi:O-methyltransferase [Collibacillus ludicampi]|jgi:predicted O-methyltransferase YrrM|uniref:tRNA 5-hydroxyuridine methyltransferase n=1 Tax=Collibacillus ludicampi TaxID=2771369 RepID=A0AAV4LAH3_9BACL|nr:O-methyltransferase [Collibacillus ludicampi]GIM44653.1 O-methyltransferase [Collibacillus ludicampi]
MIASELIDYIHNLLPESDPILQEIEQRANELYIPILDPESARFLEVLLMMKKPKRVLEVGTAIAYSTIRMARRIEGTITTLEVDPERAAEARMNLQRTGLTHKVDLIEGDAFEWIPRLDRFDLIFLDAAKGQYPRFLDLLLPHLETGGLLISDNIFFHGLVPGEREVKHKLRTIVNRLREYNRILAFHPELETTFLPLGDGMAISVKK